MLAAAFASALTGAMLAAVVDRVRDVPVLCVVFASAEALFYAVPITIGAGFASSLLPIRDLAEGTKRVAATVARLNALFEIDVPAVVDAGGHVKTGLAVADGRAGSAAAAGRSIARSSSTPARRQQPHIQR
jgi:hypothetical protein